MGSPEDDRRQLFTHATTVSIRPGASCHHAELAPAVERAFLRQTALARAYRHEAYLMDAQEQIRQLIADQTSAWNAGDIKAFVRLVSPECVFTNTLGQVFVGREEFEAHLLRAFTDVYTGSSAEQRVERLRLIGSDVAIVVTLVSLRASRGRTSGMIQTRLLQVVRRAGRDWQIEAYHNVEVRPQD